MNNDEQILTELRKISAWADMQRKMTKWSLIFIAVLLPLMIGFVLLIEKKVDTKLKDVTSLEKLDW